MCVQDTFADNMRELRLRAGLSQEALAEKSGLHRTYIGSIEQKRANISLKNVGRIAGALHVDPAILFIDGTEAREKVAAGCSGALERLVEDAPRLAPGDYALCEWEADGSVRVQPIGVYSEDLTLRILCILVEEGYAESLDGLVAAYKEVADPVLDFVHSFKGREFARKQELFVEGLGMDAAAFGKLVGEDAAGEDDAGSGGDSDAVRVGADSGAGPVGPVGSVGSATGSFSSAGPAGVSGSGGPYAITDEEIASMIKAVGGSADIKAADSAMVDSSAEPAGLQDLKGFFAGIVKEAVAEYFDEHGIPGNVAR